jgi:hypothetical protein
MEVGWRWEKETVGLEYHRQNNRPCDHRYDAADNCVLEVAVCDNRYGERGQNMIQVSAALLWIADIWSQSCISNLVLSAWINTSHVPNE